MNYEEAVDYLCNQLPFFQNQGQKAYKANLDNTKALDAFRQHPHQAYPIIHIAGTNGKGSTAHFLASILQENGLKVGLYTSPHLKDFRERIKVNGEMCDKAHVVTFLKETQEITEQIAPTFFELTTIMAFDYFKKQKVDIAVIECGLGGRLDCTNIVNPILSVITNISLDHINILGNSIEAIAREKAGIIKPNIPVVLGANKSSVIEVMQDVANSKESELLQSDTIPLAYYEASPLKGIYQKDNLATVLKATELLSDYIQPNTIQRGIENVLLNTNLQGRWQVLRESPLTITDTGHNEDAIRLLVQQLTALNKPLHIVWAMMADKDVDAILSLLPKNAKYYFSQCQMPRTLKVDVLVEKARQFGLQGQAFETIAEGVKAANQKASSQEVIFIGGSTFTVAEVL